MEWRPAPGAPQDASDFDESLYRQVEGQLGDQVGNPVGNQVEGPIERLDEPTEVPIRQRLIVEYARLFARDHEAIDDAFFDRLRADFGDDEILDLTVCVARFLSMGRITRVLRLDHECPIDP